MGRYSPNHCQSHVLPPDPAFRDFLTWLRLSFSALRLTFSAR